MALEQQTPSAHPKVLSVLVKNIPSELRIHDRWVLWKHIPRKKNDGQIAWTKTPICADGSPAKTNDSTTWVSFDEAVRALGLVDCDGLGFVLDSEIHGIDLDDCRDPNSGELSELAREVLTKTKTYAEISPSGTGIKIFGKTNLESNRAKHDMGVELYCSGRYFTVTGHAIEGHENFSGATHDINWLINRVWGNIPGPTDQGLATSFSNLQPTVPEWDLERVIGEILPHLDPDCGYQDWLNVGLALHHQGNGEVEWLEAWDDWSQDSHKWADGECEQKWASFRKNSSKTTKKITLRTLLKETAEKRSEINTYCEANSYQELLKNIRECVDATELERKIAPLIANNHSLSDIEREEIANVMDIKLKELGKKISITKIRKWLDQKTKVLVQKEIPVWAQSWVYITDNDRFFDTITKEEITSQGFRAKFNRFMPVDQQNRRLNANEIALENWGIPTVTHKGYVPFLDTIFENFDVKWVNTYRPDSAPSIPGVLSPRDIESLEIIKNHFQIYLHDDRERELLISFIAHNVQHPGKKIRWAPYIHGIEGDGKSFFAELMATAMGGLNVRSINGSTLENNFTDWIVGYAVIAIEEMKQHGHSRYDIMNKLKPLITNSAIEIHPKGKTAYMAVNVANFIIFSNYLDGAPISDTDRRYMFLSSSITTEKVVELNRISYYQKLFDALTNSPGAIRGWLMQYQLHPEFSANGRAPETAVKQTVIEISKSDIELELDEILSSKLDGISKNVISTKHLTRYMLKLNINVPQTTRLHRLIASKGFRIYKRMRWDGSLSQIWVHNQLNPTDEAVIQMLNDSQDEALLN